MLASVALLLATSTSFAGVRIGVIVGPRYGSAFVVPAPVLSVPAPVYVAPPAIVAAPYIAPVPFVGAVWVSVTISRGTHDPVPPGALDDFVSG